jgi:hypothetical protein
MRSVFEVLQSERESDSNNCINQLFE